MEFNAIMIGGRIDRLRNQRGLSIEDLATRAGLNKNTVNRVVKGIGQPNLDTFFKLCNALGVTPNDVMDVGPENDTHYRVFRKSDPGNLKFHAQEPGICLGLLHDQLPDSALTCIRMELDDAGPAKSHAGDELLVCIQGRVGVTIGNATENLDLGDAVLFHATEPHSCCNADPQGNPSVALSVMTIPYLP